tara:strand:+ start:9275 stop:9928 length:654 start_codon:yes stop_codon:yes gene_type:complete
MNNQITEQVFNKMGTVETADFYNQIDQGKPHPDWVVELPSKVARNDKYKTIKLEKMEQLMRSMFGYAGISEISEPIINQDKNGRFAVTVRVIYEFKAIEGYIRKLPGIATVVVNDITMLELATPKASSMAVKNAIKQLGGLFGRYLNQSETAEEELPSEDKKVSIEDQREAVTEGILASNTIADLKSWRSLVYSKLCTPDQQGVYETKLRQLSTTKN